MRVTGSAEVLRGHVVQELAELLHLVLGRGSVLVLVRDLDPGRLENLRDLARKQVDRIRQSPSLQREIERLEKSIHSIEEMLTRLRETEGRETGVDDSVEADAEVIDPEIDDRPRN